MTRFLNATELQQKILNELLALYQKVQVEMKNYPKESVEYNNLLALLQSISRIINIKRSMQHRPRGY